MYFLLSIPVLCIFFLCVYLSFLSSLFFLLFYFFSVLCVVLFGFFFFFKQKTAYEMRISDWSSDVCSSDLVDRPDLLVLPEHFDWAGGTTADKVAAADRVPDGQAYAMAREVARRNRVWVHAGSLLERIEGEERIYNTTVVFDRTGREAARYRKIHKIGRAHV